MKRTFCLSACIIASGVIASAACGPAKINYDAVYVVNGEGKSLTVINAQTLAVTATFALDAARFPHHAYLTPDRTKLSVADPGADLSLGHAPQPSTGHGTGHGSAMSGGQVFVLDAANGMVSVKRALEHPAHNAVFSPDGQEIWTTQMVDAGFVLVLDAKTLETKQQVDVGKMPAEVTFSREGRFAVVANGGSDTGSVLDAASKSVVATVAVGDNPVGAWPGDDGVMYVDNETGKSLSAIDATTHTVIRSYTLGFTPAMAQTAGGGELWVTDTENGQVVFFDASGARTGELVAGHGAHAIAFSDDKKTAFITNQEEATVSVVDTATKTVKKTIAVGAKPNGIVFRSAP